MCTETQGDLQRLALLYFTSQDMKKQKASAEENTVRGPADYERTSINSEDGIFIHSVMSENDKNVPSIVCDFHTK